MSTAAELAAMEAYPYENSGDPVLVELAEAFEKGWYAKPDLTVTTEQVTKAVKKANGGRANPQDDGWVMGVLASLGVKVEEV